MQRLFCLAGPKHLRASTSSYKFTSLTAGELVIGNSTMTPNIWCVDVRSFYIQFSKSLHVASAEVDPNNLVVSSVVDAVRILFRRDGGGAPAVGAGTDEELVIDERLTYLQNRFDRFTRPLRNLPDRRRPSEYIASLFCGEQSRLISEAPYFS